MTYRLALDLGTTYSTAAVERDGRVSIVALGNRKAAIPSVVYRRNDGVLVVGDAAEARGQSEPGRVAREFKRRVGDRTAYILGGEPILAEELMAALARDMVAEVVAKEGENPSSLVLTHPANWTTQRRDLLVAAVRDAVEPFVTDVSTLLEPEAAAVHYAATERVEPGHIVAVYDLGGGTFDAAVLRRSPDIDGGFELLGRPEGIDRLGGIDFDAAVYANVNRFLDGALDSLDPTDPAVSNGLARLRGECVEAKEALSSDTDVSISVLLAGRNGEVRMTRQEFEDMIRPALGDTVGALQRALRSAGVGRGGADVILLVGGSSRIPLVAQLVGAEFGTPVAVDVHPKHAVVLGAAQARTTTPSTDDVARNAEVTPAPVPPATQAVAPEPPRSPPSPTSAASPASSAPLVAPSVSPKPRRRLALLVLGGLVAAAIIAGVIVARRPGTSAPAAVAAGTAPTNPRSTAPPTNTSASPVATPTVATPSTAAAPTPSTVTVPSGDVVLPAPAACPPATVQPFVCMTSVGVKGTVGDSPALSIPFEVRGYTALIGPAPNRHIHFYFPVGPMAEDPLNAGSSGPNKADWIQWDEPNPFGIGGTAAPYTVADVKRLNARAICVLVASSTHVVTPGTGNCLPLPATALGG